MQNLKRLSLLACVLALWLSACRSGPDGPAVTPPPVNSTFTLIALKSGEGSVTSSPAGIACGDGCSNASKTFPANTPVTLTATPNPGNGFSGWSGYATCGAARTCVVTGPAGSTIAVTATFGQPPSVGDVVVLTTDNHLVSFLYSQPATTRSDILITGLAANESVLGIDYRPTAGDPVLYGVTNLNRVYRLDPGTGAASGGIALCRQVTPGACATPAETVTFTGTAFGVDFNPKADRLRVVGDDGQNLAINVDTGVTAVDSKLNGAATSATAAAYSNDFTGTSGTALYVINHLTKKLYLQNPPASGTLTEVGSLNIPGSISAINGFDISGSGVGKPGDISRPDALFVATTGNVRNLYYINLVNGQAVLKSGPVTADNTTNPLRQDVRGLAVLPVAAPGIGNAFALSDAGTLLNFNRALPANILSRVQITGLVANDRIVGIDYRPETQMLYGLASGARLYTIDPGSGQATRGPDLTADATDTTAPIYAGLSGSNFGVDFNPVNHRLRVVSNNGQNLLINPDDGKVVADPNLFRPAAFSVPAGAPVPAAATGAAYTNSLAAASTSALFDIDSNNDVLVSQNESFANGQLTNVGPLGLDVAGVNGFDIDARTGVAYAALLANNKTALYKINLATGAATGVVSGALPAGISDLIGGGTETIDGLALKQPITVVYALAGPSVISFLPNTPATLLSSKTISGPLGAGETLQTLDLRTSDNNYYGISSAGRIFTIAPATGVLTLVGPMNQSPNDNTPPVFTGFAANAEFGSDFNPRQGNDATAASLRVVDSAADNVRTNVGTGETFADTKLSVNNQTPFTSCQAQPGSTPIIGAVAYSNVVPTGSSAEPQLFAINLPNNMASSSCLYTIDTTGQTTNGQLNAVGDTFSNSTGGLGPTPTSAVMGFDIAGGQDGVPLAALDTGAAQSSLYIINLGNGTARLVNGTATGAAPSVIGPASTPKVRALSIVLQDPP